MCADVRLCPVVRRCLPSHVYRFVIKIMLKCGIHAVGRRRPLPPVASHCLLSSPVLPGCFPAISRSPPLPPIVVRCPPLSPAASRGRPSAPAAARCPTLPRLVSSRVPAGLHLPLTQAICWRNGGCRWLLHPRRYIPRASRNQPSMQPSKHAIVQAGNQNGCQTIR